MGKPPTTDEELTRRVAALEGRADETDAAVASLDARVTALEAAATAPAPEPPDGTWGGVAPPVVDNTLPIPPPVIGGGPILPPDRVDNTLPVPQPKPPEPQPEGSARVVVTRDGQDFVYDESEAADIGGIDDPLAALLDKPPRFHMTRRRATDGPWRIDFSRVADWLGIVVALGDYATPAPQNSGPYACVVNDGTGVSETISIAMHPWHSRWRWQNKPWPFPPTPLADLYTAKLLPRFDPSLTMNSDYYVGPYTYEPLGLAGLLAYMPTTGGRSDIGPVTGTQGWYLTHETDTQALADVLAQGEAGATYPWAFYDPATGACIDPIVANPTAGLYGAQHGANPAISYPPQSPLVEVTLTGPPGMVLSVGTEWHFVNSSDEPVVQMRVPSNATLDAGGQFTAMMERMDAGNTLPTEPLTVILWDGSTPPVSAVLTGNLIYGSGMWIDSAHMPAVAYVPYLLTGDPYFLEILQSQATFIAMENGSAPPGGGVGLQSRAAGWSARTLAQAARVSPDNPPSWLQPRSIWQTAIVQWEQTWRRDTIDNADASRQAVHLLMSDTNSTTYQPWQEDIALIGISWVAFLHPQTRWLDDVRWLIQQGMARLDDCGWPDVVPAAYSAVVSGAGGEPFYDWPAMWAASMPTYGWTETPATPQYDTANWGHMVASLALAWQAGAAECEAALTHLEEMYVAGLEQQKIWRWSQNAIAGPTSS